MFSTLIEIYTIIEVVKFLYLNITKVELSQIFHHILIISINNYYLL